MAMAHPPFLVGFSQKHFQFIRHFPAGHLWWHRVSDTTAQQGRSWTSSVSLPSSITSLRLPVTGCKTGAKLGTKPEGEKIHGFFLLWPIWLIGGLEYVLFFQILEEFHCPNWPIFSREVETTSCCSALTNRNTVGSSMVLHHQAAC